MAYNERKIAREIECLQRRYNRAYQDGMSAKYLKSIEDDIRRKNATIAKPVYTSIILQTELDEVGRKQIVGAVIYGPARKTYDKKGNLIYESEWDEPKRVRFVK